MKCNGYNKRLTAWLLTFLMIISLIMTPAGNVQAADMEVTNATDSTKSVYVEFPLEKSAATYNQYKVTIHNNTGGTISDWTITVKFNSNPGWNAGWNGATYDPNTMTMTINTYAGSDWDNATIYDKVYDTGAGFQIAAGALDNATVTLTYDNGVSNEGPSSGGDPGSGSGSSSVTDTSTNKDLNVEYNYAKVLQESLYFYDANMCGNLEGTCALDWRGNCHTYDSKVTYTNGGETYNVDVSGGFHDAGDHVKFGLPQGYAATMLGMSYYQFEDAYTELGQTAHLQRITDYFCDYFRRCTVYDKNDKSKVIAFCYQVGDGGTDHALWSAPEGQTLSRPAYFADSSNPATDQVSVAIAALAMNYINFGNEADLQVAKDLFTFVQGNTLRCATDGCSSFYPSSSWGDDYATAAAALYVATGRNNETYKTVYDTYKNDSKNGVNEYWVVDWDNTGAFAVMLMGQDNSKLTGMVNTCKAATILDGVFSCLFEWGSCRYNAAAQFVGLVYDKNTSTTTYKSWATSQMNYIIGDNPNKRCYIVGYNENSSQYPHHRAASRSTDAAVTNENHYTLLGALVGGPSSNGVYKDDQADYECNEVALDYNAGLVGAAAGLYLAHKDADSVYLSYAKKDTDNYSTELATAEELAAMGVKTQGTGSAETIPVESVTLDVTQIALQVGEIQTLTATISPDNATSKKVIWSSSDTAVATVSNGVVTAVAAGTATITAKSGEKTATCTVTVQKPAELVAIADKLDCGMLTYGYTATTSTTTNVKNVGEVDTKPSATTLEAGTYFEIQSQPTGTTISPNGVSTVSVKPKTGLAAGTYTDNVCIIYNGKTLKIPVSVIVNKKPIEIKANDAEKIYGESNPSFSVDDSYKTRLEPGDSLSYQLTTTATENSDVGTYPIVLTATDHANYEVKATNGTLTVQKKAVNYVSFPIASAVNLNQSLADSVLSGGSTEYGTFTWKNTEETLVKGASSYDVVLTLSDNALRNHSFVDVEGFDSNTDTITRKVSVNVIRADLPAVTFPTASDIIYGQSIKDSSLKGGSVAYGTFTWEDEDYVPTENEIGTIQKKVIFTWNDACKAEYGLDENEMTLEQMVTLRVNKQENNNLVATPILTSRTASAIAVNETQGVVYSLDKKNWQKSGTFNGLSPFTSYQVYAKYEETSTQYESAICTTPLCVHTLMSDPYTIDVSKVTDAAYMDALRTVSNGIESAPTATYNNGVLTLIESEHTYIIIGTNDEVTVKTSYGNTNVVLNDTIIKQLDISDTTQAVIDVDGNVTVDSIISTSDNEVKISGTGTLNVEYILVEGTLTIEGLTIIADATKSEQSAIAAGSIIIKNASVEVNVSADSGKSPITSDDITLVGDNSISSSEGANNIYSSTPKDEEGNVIVEDKHSILVNRITLDTNSVTLEVGESKSLTATIEPADAGNKSVAWSSSNPTVATVTEDGKVHAVIQGTTIITAKAKDGSGVTSTCKVTVVKPQSETVYGESIKITGSTKKVAPGKKLNLQATVYPDNAVNKQVKWKVSNKKYAKVSSKGVVTTKKAGKGKKVTVTAYLADDSSVKATYKISIMKSPVKKIKLLAKIRTIKKGKSVTVKARFAPSKGISKELTWSSSNKKVATVNAKGKVTGKKKGTAKITAKAKDGSGKKATIKIKVK